MINDTALSVTDDYTQTNYLKNVMSRTPQKNLNNYSMNPILSDSVTKKDLASYTLTNETLNDKICLSPGLTKITATFMGELGTLYTDDDIPGNCKVTVFLTANDKYASSLYRRVGDGQGVSARFELYALVYDNDPVPTVGANRFYIRSSIVGLNMLYAVSVVEKPPKHLKEIQYAEIYTVRVPLINRVLYQEHVTDLPLSISAFAVMFRNVDHDDNTGLRKNFNIVDFDVANLINFEFKYGDVTLPRDKLAVDFSQNVDYDRRHNYKVFQEYINQIAEYNNGNGSLLSMTQWSACPILYYMVRKPRNDANNKLTSRLTFKANPAPVNPLDTIANMEMVIFGFKQKLASLHYNENGLIREITVDEL